MRQFNLYDYLKKLDKQHLKQIEKYLKSPFFKVHSRARLIALFQNLRKHHPAYDINDEQLAAKLGIANKNQISNLKVHLRKCIENYLRINKVSGSEQLQVYLLAESLDELDLNEPLKKFAEAALDQLTAKKALTSNAKFKQYNVQILDCKKCTSNL